MIDIPTYLEYARIAQYEEAAKIRRDSLVKGGALVPNYSRLLYILQKQIGNRYTLAPSDTSLFKTAEYMYSLSGKRKKNTTPVATPFIIIIQPVSQSVSLGANVTFIVAVAGGTTPYTYQWYFNNGILTGETNPTLSLTSVDSGDAGAYKCIIHDANGQVLTSQNAILTVNVAQLTADWYYGDTDPWPAISTGTDNLTYLGSVNFNAGGPIIIPWPAASADNKYRVVRYPVAEANITSWVNIVGQNYGPVPGTAYNPIATITTKKYVVSKGDSVQSPYSVTYSE